MPLAALAMAPLAKLVSAAEERAAKLAESQGKNVAELESVEAAIVEKSAEKSIAALDAVREMRKTKENLNQEIRVGATAISIVEKALAKLRLAEKLGLSRWDAVHEEAIQLSDFVRQKLTKDPAAIERLKVTCDAASLSLSDGALQFLGGKEGGAKLNEALEALAADYEERVDVEEADALDLFVKRGEFVGLAKRHGVTISRDGATSVRVVGPPKVVAIAASLVRGLFTGSADLDVPTKLVGAANTYAKDVEIETGAVVELGRTGGWGGGGVAWLRGVDTCVEEAREKMQAWLDEREGATSEFLGVIKDSAEWPAGTLSQFQNDLQMMGGKFGIVVKQREPLEFRGPPDAVAGAVKEYSMILGFYEKEHAKQRALASKAAAAAAASATAAAGEADEGWGAAPVAEPTPSSW